jgi:cytosine/adenosine deaminase-related metal-dependent hydrolase
MLATSAARASESLGIALGRLTPDAAADVVVTDYCPSTPLTSANVAGHFIFAMGAQHVKDVLVDGQWVMRDRRIETCNERQSRQTAKPVAEHLWREMERYVCE